MGIKQYYQAMAASMFMAMLGQIEEKDAFQKMELVGCGDCKNFPTPPKSFCKKAGHSVKKTTPCINCKHFE